MRSLPVEFQMEGLDCSKRLVATARPGQLWHRRNVSFECLTHVKAGTGPKRFVNTHTINPSRFLGAAIFWRPFFLAYARLFRPAGIRSAPELNALVGQCLQGPEL